MSRVLVEGGDRLLKKGEREEGTEGGKGIRTELGGGG